MTKTRLPVLLLSAAALVLAGCSTSSNAVGQRHLKVLGGAFEVAEKSYMPVDKTSIPISSASDRPSSKLTGQRVSILWGLFTLTDY
jgi:hypothetical protein